MKEDDLLSIKDTIIDSFNAQKCLSIKVISENKGSENSLQIYC